MQTVSMSAILGLTLMWGPAAITGPVQEPPQTEEPISCPPESDGCFEAGIGLFDEDGTLLGWDKGVTEGAPLDGGQSGGAEKALVQAAIDMIKSWEALGCAQELTPGEEGETPVSDLLQQMLDKGNICAEQLEQKTIDGFLVAATTSSPPELIDPTPPWGEHEGQFYSWYQCGAPGININPVMFDDNAVPDAEGNYTFHEGTIADLALALIHEAMHHLDPDPVISFDFGLTEKFEYEQTRAIACALMSCAGAALSDEVKEALCDTIRTSNGMLGGEDVELCQKCEACEAVPGFSDGAIKAPCPGAVIDIPVIEVEDDFSDIRVKTFRLNDGVVTLNPWSGELIFDIDGPDGVLDETISFVQEGIEILPLDMAEIGEGLLLVSGAYQDTGAASFVQVAYQPGSNGFIVPLEVYSGIEVSKPMGMYKVEGTLMFRFVDGPTGRIMDFNLRNGQFSTVEDFSDIPDFFLYDNMATYIGSRDGVRTVLHMVTRESVSGHCSPFGESINFIDSDGDGVVNYRVRL